MLAIVAPPPLISFRFKSCALTRSFTRLASGRVFRPFASRASMISFWPIPERLSSASTERIRCGCLLQTETGGQILWVLPQNLDKPGRDEVDIHTVLPDLDARDQRAE